MKIYAVVRLLQDGSWKEEIKCESENEVRRKIEELEKKYKNQHFAIWSYRETFELNG
jgi:flavodoxin